MTPKICKVQTEIEKRVFEDWIDFGLTKEYKNLEHRVLRMQIGFLKEIEPYNTPVSISFYFFISIRVDVVTHENIKFCL